MFREYRHRSSEMNHRGCGRRGGFRGHFAPHFREEEFFAAGHRARRVPVNIEETEDSFILYLFAPALSREHLKVSTKDDLLTISYTPDENSNSDVKYSRIEYPDTGFERSFALNGKVLADDISAGYRNGILKVTLPKNPESNTPGQDISVD